MERERDIDVTGRVKTENESNSAANENSRGGSPIWFAVKSDFDANLPLAGAVFDDPSQDYARARHKG